MEKISRRCALVAASTAVSASILPSNAAIPVVSELPVNRVNRLARELSEAMDAWMEDLGIDGKSDLWKAHIYPARFTKYPVSFEHLNSDGSGSYPHRPIERLYAEWRAVRDRPNLQLETDAESEASYAEYRRLQIAIVESGLLPTSARDLAIQFIVDTDFTGSHWSEHGEKIVFDLIGEPIGAGAVS